jgi:hypothetical protein
VTEHHEFLGRSHWTSGEAGWEVVADYLAEWPVAHATGLPSHPRGQIALAWRS